jgi:hypothetical protein
MATRYLSTLVEKLATAIPDLKLDGDEQEEYSAMLSKLENQAEIDDPNDAIVNECLEYFKQVRARAA